MCIKDELKVMDDTRSIGNIIEWCGFKAQIYKLMTEVMSLRASKVHQARKIKTLEKQLNNYKERKC